MIGKLVSPSTGLDLLKKAIERIIKRPIDNYEMIYKINKGEIWFRVWIQGENEPKLGPYEDPSTIKKMFDYQLKSKGIDKAGLDIVICHYDSTSLTIFRTVNNEKQKQIIEL